MMGLLAIAMLALPVASRDQLTMIQYTFTSHLSPLLEYSPSSPTDDAEQGWNISLARHSTNHTEASVKWYGFAEDFEIQGNASNVDVEFIGAGDDDPNDTRASYVPSFYVARVTRSLFADTRGNVYNISVSTNSSEGSYMEFDRALIRSTVPADQAALDNDGLPTVLHQSASDANSDFFRDQDNAWEVMEPPSNQSVGIQFQIGGPPPARGTEFPWNSTVLSTSQVGAPLRFTVPPYTSYMQWDGTVGPDQGRYEFRLIPTGDNEPQFRPISNNQTYTGERPVNAINEAKAIAWLDPRSTYDAEIVLLEEGKRTDLHGISFWRYTEVDADIQDWWSLPKDNSLSGGQIAGIVVGSVAGAALIGILIWFLVRRRKQSGRTTRLQSKDSGSA